MRAAIFVMSLAGSLAGAAVFAAVQSVAQTPATQMPAAQTPGGGGLRDPSSFASIGDEAARSRALFAEAAKVIMSPRCMNCHPAGDRPTQGNDLHAHMPPVTRGDRS